MAIQIKLGSVTYATKTEAKASVKKLLASYSVGQQVEDWEHQMVLCDLVLMHESWKQKVGCGIAGFKVQREEKHQSKCFWLVRVDGTSTDFSYIECFNPSSPKQKTLTAMRHAVEEQIIAFKKKAFSSATVIACAGTGKPVTWDDCAIDHVVLFRDLAAEFSREIGVPLEDIETEPTRDGETETLLADKDILALWLEFHQEHAQLRVTTREFNASRRA